MIVGKAVGQANQPSTTHNLEISNVIQSLPVHVLIVIIWMGVIIVKLTNNIRWY